MEKDRRRPADVESQSRGDDESEEASQRRSASDPATGAIPEAIRRAAALGLAGFFQTEGAIRRALGDTLPQEWVDFASTQSERTRQDLIDRLASEFGQVLGTIDMSELIEGLLTGRTLEIEAKIRLAPRGEGSEETRGKEQRETDD